MIAHMWVLNEEHALWDMQRAIDKVYVARVVCGETVCTNGALVNLESMCMKFLGKICDFVTF